MADLPVYGAGAMSLGALTKDELKALVAYNLETILNATSVYRGGVTIPGDWKRLRKRIMTAVERIDRIVALNKEAA